MFLNGTRDPTHRILVGQDEEQIEEVFEEATGVSPGFTL